MIDYQHPKKSKSWRKYPLALLGGFVVLLGAWLIIKGQIWQSTAEPLPLVSQEIIQDIEETTLEPDQVDYIYCDIKGAIRTPGVYQLPVGSRLFDLVDRAGGLSDQAASDSLNLALLLEDQMVVKVLTQEEYANLQKNTPEERQTVPLMGENIMDKEGANENISLVNINTADQAQLETLPNIGPSKASKIIQYRLDHGSFSSIEELQEVSGIGPKTFESLKDLITVGS